MAGSPAPPDRGSSVAVVLGPIHYSPIELEACLAASSDVRTAGRRKRERVPFIYEVTPLAPTKTKHAEAG